MELTERQQEVLDAALALLVERGEAPTMNAVAERASCSKETLYKWFGGREGLLTATVQRQASQVQGLPVPESGVDEEVLRTSLVQFARNWLRTITGEASIALNRLAVGEAGIEGRALGRIVLENGPLAMRRRLEPVLEAGRDAGLLDFADSEEAFRVFFGLVVRDTQIRLLLGDAKRPSRQAIDDHAVQATAQFFALFGADHRGADGRRRKT
ncbi:TetR/AcrR family transcriptional regulator [Enterovirga aerilata]|uniref:TetR/AcrR family transcriptional regulator n=1 Tax=Enterovirga aerilata TaxID=2730920 RepID=UPI003211E13F